MNPFVRFFSAACLSLLALLGLFSCQEVPPSQQAVSPPNVLFIAIDDLNDWIGAMGGHPQALTPNLDRLMDKGMLFTNAHASQPVCTASRNSLLSGKHPLNTGWYTSTQAMGRTYDEVMAGSMFLPEYFRAHGYYTMSVGKIAHRGASDFKERTDQYWSQHAPHFWEDMEDGVRENGYGYGGDKFYPFPKNGGQLIELYGAGKDKAGILRLLDSTGNFHSLCGGPLDPEDLPEQGMYDKQIADWAIAQLAQPQDSPFFLATGFLRPHVPYAVPRQYFDLYDQAELILPEIPEDEMADIPMMGKAIAYGYTPKGGWYDVQQKENMLRELVHAYLASVSFVNEQVGRVLDALEKSPHADNTIIVLWSDHGQHLGEKRHFRKQALWEEASQVPLVFYDPRNPKAGTCAEPVSLLDLYPTLLDLCGLPANAHNDGMSLRPWIEGSSQARERPVLISWRYKNTAVRSKHWRYIQYRDGTEELYDHRNDPGEHHNLAGQAEYAEVIAEHKRWLPAEPALPAGEDRWEGDKYDDLIVAWQDSVPVWLE
jgi:iduronate 2-sulfatase